MHARFVVLDRLGMGSRRWAASIRGGGWGYKEFFFPFHRQERQFCERSGIADRLEGQSHVEWHGLGASGCSTYFISDIGLLQSLHQP